MKPLIPLALLADPAQVDALRPFVANRNCVVIGSAPLATRHAEIQPHELTIPVNGGISSLKGPADVWAVNSKQQDASTALMRPLHRTMLEQGSNRSVQHILLLRGPKVASERSTLEMLKSWRCAYQSWSVLDKPTKRWIEGELCARADDKKPCSGGILATALALWCGASSVRLVGFSFTPGYHYIKNDHPQTWWRDHVAADKRALAALQQRYPGLVSTPMLHAVAP